MTQLCLNAITKLPKYNMGNVYVPDETWLVCTSGMNKKQIKVHSQSSIKNQNKYLATIDDRTGGNFICSKMVIAGALIGAAVGALIFFTGGAAALALGSVMAIGATAGAATGLAAAISFPICAMTTLMYDWAPVHQNVEFENKKALIGSSTLDCLFGGKIIICFSEEYADAIVNKNRVDTLRDTVVIIGLSYFGGSLFQGVSQGVPALLTAVKAKNWIALIQAGSVVGANYTAGKTYDWLKDVTGMGNVINPESLGSTATSTYDYVSSPEGGLWGGASEIENVNTQITHTSVTQNTSINQNRTTIITPNGEVILPSTTVQQTTVGTQTIYSSTNPNASPRTTNINISSSSSSTTGYHSPSITEINNTTNNSNLNIQTNAMNQLKSTVGKGLIENVIKDIGDFVTFNLMANFGEEEIAQALLNHEVEAVKGINVRENEF